MELKLSHFGKIGRLQLSEVNMKTLGSAILVLSTLTILVSSVIPAAAAKKSKEECMTLAQQRGFTRGGVTQNRTFADFVRGCMKGTQQ
jgi:hypothetical protein